jgi:hypothetical protein
VSDSYIDQFKVVEKMESGISIFMRDYQEHLKGINKGK